jgi:hypothetical protein
MRALRISRRLFLPLCRLTGNSGPPMLAQLPLAFMASASALCVIDHRWAGRAERVTGAATFVLAAALMFGNLSGVWGLLSCAVLIMLVMLSGVSARRTETSPRSSETVVAMRIHRAVGPLFLIPMVLQQSVDAANPQKTLDAHHGFDSMINILVLGYLAFGMWMLIHQLRKSRRTLLSAETAAMTIGMGLMLVRI